MKVISYTNYRIHYYLREWTHVKVDKIIQKDDISQTVKHVITSDIAVGDLPTSIMCIIFLENYSNKIMRHPNSQEQPYPQSGQGFGVGPCLEQVLL